MNRSSDIWKCLESGDNKDWLHIQLCLTSQDSKTMGGDTRWIYLPTAKSLRNFCLAAGIKSMIVCHI